MTEKISVKFHHTLLKVWHAWLAGGFLVAYLTADEDTFAMHQFAGYAVLAAIAVRLLAGIFVSPSSPLRLRRPDIKATVTWFSVRRGRHPLFAWLAAALLIAVGLAAMSGAIADFASWFEDAHEVIVNTALWVIFGHLAFVLFISGGKRYLRRAVDWLSKVRSSTPSRENSL